MNYIVSVQRKGGRADDRDIVYEGTFDQVSAYVHVHTCSKSLRNLRLSLRTGSFTASGPNGVMFRAEREALENVATEFANTTPGIDGVAFLAPRSINTDECAFVCPECGGSGMIDAGV